MAAMVVGFVFWAIQVPISECACISLHLHDSLAQLPETARVPHRLLPLWYCIRRRASVLQLACNRAVLRLLLACAAKRRTLALLSAAS
jgi:hypothetical protein